MSYSHNIRVYKSTSRLPRCTSRRQPTAVTSANSIKLQGYTATTCELICTQWASIDQAQSYKSTPTVPQGPQAKPGQAWPGLARHGTLPPSRSGYLGLPPKWVNCTWSSADAILQRRYYWSYWRYIEATLSTSKSLESIALGLLGLP